MLVEKRMRKNPQTITPEDYLASALAKMHKGGFRRLPVVKDGKLVGIITDRDLREHTGLLERTRVGAAMTKDLMTVTSRTTLEQAAKLMLSHKISGLPVTDAGKLVGIITTSDILQAFLDVMGASEEGSSRIDFPSGRRSRSRSRLEDDRGGGRRGSRCGDVQGEVGRKPGVLLAPRRYGPIALLMYSRKKGIRYWAYTYELPARHRASDELCPGRQAC